MKSEILDEKALEQLEFIKGMLEQGKAITIIAVDHQDVTEEEEKEILGNVKADPKKVNKVLGISVEQISMSHKSTKFVQALGINTARIIKGILPEVMEAASTKTIQQVQADMEPSCVCGKCDPKDRAEILSLLLGAIHELKDDFKEFIDENGMLPEVPTMEIYEKIYAVFDKRRDSLPDELFVKLEELRERIEANDKKEK